MMLKKYLLLAAVAGLLPAQLPTSGGNTYLGVWIWQVDSARAKELRLPEAMGVEVTRVSDGSPADQAGIQAGDVVTHYNGQRISNMDQFSTLVRDTHAGAKVELQIYRNGAPLSVTAKIAAVAPPRPFVVVPRNQTMVPDLPRSLTTWRSPMLGMDTEAIDGQLAGYFGVMQGVLVRNVARDSVAQRAGVRAGDVIIAVGGTKVTTPTEVTMRLREKVASSLDLKSAGSGSSVTLQLMRERKEAAVTLLLDLTQQ